MEKKSFRGLVMLKSVGYLPSRKYASPETSVYRSRHKKKTSEK